MKPFIAENVCHARDSLRSMIGRPGQFPPAKEAPYNVAALENIQEKEF